MSEIQLVLALLALAIFTMFFKQLFSGNYPKRGVDFEANIPNANSNLKNSAPIAGNRASRVSQLMNIAQESLDKGDNIEAKKALESLLILEPKNLDALRMLGVAYLNMNNYSKAKEQFLEALQIEPNDDLTHNLLANTLHKLGEDSEAVKHHKIAIELDPNYATHYYNYANTLYDLGQVSQALNLYKKALELNPHLEEAKKMIKEIENGNNK